MKYLQIFVAGLAALALALIAGCGGQPNAAAGYIPEKAATVGYIDITGLMNNPTVNDILTEGYDGEGTWKDALKSELGKLGLEMDALAGEAFVFVADMTGRKGGLFLATRNKEAEELYKLVLREGGSEQEVAGRTVARGRESDAWYILIQPNLMLITTNASPQEAVAWTKAPAVANPLTAGLAADDTLVAFRSNEKGVAGAQQSPTYELITVRVSAASDELHIAVEAQFDSPETAKAEMQNLQQAKMLFAMLLEAQAPGSGSMINDIAVASDGKALNLSLDRVGERILKAVEAHRQRLQSQAENREIHQSTGGTI